MLEWICMWYAGQAMGWTIWGSIPGSTQGFPHLHNVQSCLWAQPASFSVGTMGSFSRGSVSWFADSALPPAVRANEVNKVGAQHCLIVEQMPCLLLEVLTTN